MKERQGKGGIFDYAGKNERATHQAAGKNNGEAASQQPPHVNRTAHSVRMQLLRLFFVEYINPYIHIYIDIYFHKYDNPYKCKDVNIKI